MLEIKNNEFFMDSKPFKIYSGAMHYFRIFPDYWDSCNHSSAGSD